MTGSTGKVFPSAKQVKAARMLLSITQEQLAAAAGITTRTIERFEAGENTPHESTMQKIREAFSARGIVFTNGGRPGVIHDPDKASLPA